MINHPYKLLILDIDGTLVGKSGVISEEDREAIARACSSGIHVSLSTGRVAQSCLGIIKELSLDGNHIFFDGALVSRPDAGEEVYDKPLGESLLNQAIEYVRANDVYMELYTSTRYFAERETESADIHRKFFGLEPEIVDFTTLDGNDRVIKGELFTASPEDEAKARSFQEQFDGRLRFSWASTPAYPGYYFVNIVDPVVSKGKALEALVSHMGISMSEVAAVGDGRNDISVLSLSGLAIAMGNAPDEVKAVADYVTLDVEQSGLAAAIERFLG